MKRDWKHILFTVFLALLLWVIVTLSSNFYTSVYLPIKVHLSDSTLAVSAVSHRFVIVGVQGEGWVLSGYYWGGDRSIDVYPENKKGSQIITARDLIKQEKLFTSETNVVNVMPEVFTVTIEEKIKKEVFVKPFLRLVFAPKYELVEAPRVIPPKIVIEGPKSLVKKTDTLKTKFYRFENLKDTLTFTAEIAYPRYIYPEKKSVQIFLNVQKIVDKQIKNVELEIKGVPKNAELIIFPTRVAVNVRGGINLLGKLTEKEVSAFVLYGEALKDTTGAIKPHVLLPEGIELLGVVPNKIEYVIKK